VTGPVDVVTDPLDRAAWSWVSHLLHGGTTTWAAWVEDAAARADDVERPAGLQSLPGAAQLELLRLLVETAGGPLDPDLALRVLRRPAPGRGAVDLPLGWPGEGQVTADGFHHRSAPPTDPGSIDTQEVLRVAAGVVADVLLESPDTATTAPPARLARLDGRSLVPRRGPSVWVEGPPRSAAAVRAELAAVGTRLHRGRLRWRGGRTLPDEVLVVVPPLERGLLEVWEDRSVAGAARRWELWVQELEGSGRLPPSLRSRTVAKFWAERIGAERVRVLVRPGQDAAGDLTALEVDVVRRVNAVLLLHRHEAERAPLASRLAAQLQGLGREIGLTGPEVLRVPPAQLRWLRAWSARITDGLSAAGYPVEGDLASLRPRPPAEDDVWSLDPREVLALMAALLLRRPGGGPPAARPRRLP
jgi:hypothetical protein